MTKPDTMAQFSTPSSHRSAHGEVPFAIDEIFFSRTDMRGVIQAGNDVFQRVSGFGWDHLIGAPHKVIRHADMPSGVFHILWERIKKGIPTGAYVKNCSDDGRFYWVYAVISPVEGGYLSVRIKPSTALAKTIGAEYKAFRKAEVEGGLSAAQSATAIRARLAELGYASYSAFSADALAQELTARDAALGRDADRRLSSLRALVEPLRALCDEQQKLFLSFEAIRGIPSNMRIVASRLEPAGGPISAISQNYRLMSGEISNHLKSFMASGNERDISEVMLEQVRGALFVLATARIQREVREDGQTQRTGGDNPIDWDRENAILGDMLNDYTLKAGRELQSVTADVRALVRATRDLRQLVTGLDSIRVLCRVEAGRLGTQSAALAPVIDQLDRFHKEIDANLERIHDIGDRISNHIDSALPRRINGTLR
ncbi:Aerotaxis receptor [Aquimixticola soesokkakensis]|uniref:Aerotaxis receptor n=1 Tax=Aquimixticola soesokkakensis TaxID=1519096 RepID=A0A1Y5SUE4_9RHOB|nr:PAS domain-containing protein [Aquimixticola soesokkakensis]SLN48567.1 Aerotaxis receptor [Aquimixticola soesokkakensis]